MKRYVLCCSIRANFLVQLNVNSLYENSVTVEKLAGYFEGCWSHTINMYLNNYLGDGFLLILIQAQIKYSAQKMGIWVKMELVKWVRSIVTALLKCSPCD